jgi:hypothetical protein
MGLNTEMNGELHFWWRGIYVGRERWRVMTATLYSATRNSLYINEISGSHGGEYEDDYIPSSFFCNTFNDTFFGYKYYTASNEIVIIEWLGRVWKTALVA